MSTIASLEVVGPPSTMETVRPGRPQAVLVAGLILAGLLLLAPQLLNDPDTLWHAAVGRDIWRTGAVPWTDAYSHTFTGQPWIAKEWLAQVLLGGLLSAGGWSAVVVGTALVLAATFGVMQAWLGARLRGTIALGLTLLAAIFLAPHFLARPLIFGQLALLLFAIGLARASETGRAPHPTLLLVLAAWANLHGSFTFALPLAAAFGLDALLRAKPAARVRLATRWALFGLGTLLAVSATPYGIHALGVTAAMFGSGESLPFITEWQPLAFDRIGCLAAASAVCLLALLSAEPRRNLARIAMLLVLAAMTARHTRFLDLYAILAPILAAEPIARRWPAARAEADSPHGARVWAPAIGVALAILLSAASLVVRPVAPGPAIAPRAALEAARRAGVSGPVFNDYDLGGFLIAEHVPTFIDGRTDQLFLGGFMSGLYGAVRDPDGGPFLAFLDRHGVGWALVQAGSAEAAHLDRAPGWRRVHSDPVAVVYSRG